MVAQVLTVPAGTAKESDRLRVKHSSFIINFIPLVLPPSHHICVPRTLLWAAPSEKKRKETNRVVYAENTVKQNAKQILCLFSACDHLKGIFQRPRLILAPAKWSFHSAPAIFSPSEGADQAKPPLCDQIVSKWVVYMQIHLGVNNGRTSACLCVRVCLFLENTGASLCQCSDAVSANVGCFGAGKHRLTGLRVNHQECFIALQLTASSQRYDSTLMCSIQSQRVWIWECCEH